MTAVRYVFDYMFGLGIFGLTYWLLNGILVEFRSVSSPGDVYDWGNYVWWGSLVVYLVFGAFWLPRKLKEWQFER